MKVRVKLFAAARQLAGRDTVEVVLAEPAAIAELRTALVWQIPALEQLLRHAMFAIGTEYADDGTLISEQSDLACIPPVSGG